MASTSQIKALLYSALAEPLGLGLTSSDPQALANQIRQVRARLMKEDPGLEEISLRLFKLEDCPVVLIRQPKGPKVQKGTNHE